MKRTLEQLAEPGASSWLGALPLKEQGFNLNKAEFQDAMCLRYDKTLKNLPSKCPCGTNFSVTHAMNCHRGGFINIRHNNIRNFEAHLLKEVCNDVQIEPPLQPVNGVNFHRSAIVTDEARLDIRARGFWREGQNAYFDVRTTNADNNSQRNKTIKAIQCQSYGNRARDIYTNCCNRKRCNRTRRQQISQNPCRKDFEQNW